MTAPDDPEDIVTLVRLGELPAAQLLCGRLESEGIECLIPDEIMATQTWHLNRAIGGIRVQVRKADLERAKQILDQPGMSEDARLAANAENQAEAGSGVLVPGDNGKDDDGSISVGDRAAYRAMRVALVSLWLMGLIHPYSLLLAVGPPPRHHRTAGQRAGLRVDRAGRGAVGSLAPHQGLNSLQRSTDGWWLWKPTEDQDPRWPRPSSIPSTTSCASPATLAST